MAFLDFVTLFGTGGKAAAVESRGFLPEGYVKRSEIMEDASLGKNPLLKKIAKLQKDFKAFCAETEKIKRRLAEIHAMQDAAFRSGAPVIQADMRDLDEAIPKLRLKNNSIMDAVRGLEEEMYSEIAAKYPQNY